MKPLNLPSCKRFRDKNTGAIHEVCPIVEKDMGRVGLVDNWRGGHELMYDSQDVMEHAKENFKQKDIRAVLKMAVKTFRAAQKQEKETSGGLGYSKLNFWGKRKDSSSV